MQNRITASLCMLIVLQGCSSKSDDGLDETTRFEGETPVNEATNGIDFRENEPARRIATDILAKMDLQMKHGPIPNRQRLIAMKEEDLTFCSGSLSDKKITAYIETTIAGSKFGDLQTFGAKVYCVNDMGAIRLMSHKDVSLPPNDMRQITWADVDPSRASAAPVPVPLESPTQPQASASPDIVEDIEIERADQEAQRAAEEADRAAAAYGMETFQDGRCELKVYGKIIMKGACQISLDRGGSFSIYENIDPGYFATVLRNGATAQGYWNKDRGTTHAHTELGTLHREGACWVNESARVCAWAS